MTVNPGIREGREFMDCRECGTIGRHTRTTGCILDFVAATRFDADEMLPRDSEIAALEDLICALWLYVGWKYVTEKLTTEQRDLFADVIDRYHLREFPDDYVPTDRWWRHG